MAGDGSRIISSARVVRIADGAAWFDIGSKFASPIPLTDWDGGDPPKVGDKYPIMIDDDCDVADRPLKIIRRRVCMPIMGDLKETFASLSVGQHCTGRVTRRIRDGFLIDIGVNSFLPDDCVSPALRNNPDTFIDRKVTCRIISIDRERRIICVAIIADSVAP